jgi:EPS-associated MarR family transcriptional regulator
MPGNKLDYELLQQIATQPSASQRGLAARLGVSVGKLNYCLRALVDKGWVKASNFRRSDNKLAYAYLLTPSGVSAKLQLTRDFLASKEREFEKVQAEIAVLRSEVLQDQTTAQALLRDVATMIESHPDKGSPERANG